MDSYFRKRSGDGSDGHRKALRTVFLAMSFDGSRRSSAIAKASGFLLRKNIDPMVALDLVRLFNAARCDPPLADSEVVRCLAAIVRRELERRDEICR